MKHNIYFNNYILFYHIKIQKYKFGLVLIENFLSVNCDLTYISIYIYNTVLKILRQFQKKLNYSKPSD